MIKIKKCPMALLACALLFGIFFAVNSYAADEGLLNKTENLSADALSARSALLDAENAISEMKDAGFNTKRATDSMQSAVQLYSGQLSLESLGKNASYEEITKKAKEIYKKRKETVEPPIGHIKENIGFRNFLTRSLNTVKNEFNLACSAHNIRKIWILIQKKKKEKPVLKFESINLKTIFSEIKNNFLEIHKILC